MTKMLTITDSGGPPPDFCWAVEGELAAPAINADSCRTPGCGCDRSHVGMSSAKASTTLRVREVSLDYGDVVLAYRQHLSASGLDALLADPQRVAEETVSFVLAVADGFDEGTVLRPVFDYSSDEWVYSVVEEVSR